MSEQKTPIAYAPPSLSVRVQCTNKHPMTGLFVILRAAVAGPPHPLDRVVEIANSAAAARAGTGTTNPAAAPSDPSAAPPPGQFFCTIVDGHGFLQPVHDGNPWHWIFGHDPPVGKPPGGATQRTGDIARVPMDPDAKYVGCLLRHPQPNVARALTVWLNTGQDPDGHGFATWSKPRSAALPGEPPLGGRELLAAPLALTTESTKGIQLVLTVSEDAADFLPPKFDAHGGWLLYHDMPHASCDPVKQQVTALQRRLGLLRFPIGGEGNIYAPVAQNLGTFDFRTLSAVHTFQEHAGRGEAFKPAAWPPGHDEASDGDHDWWFAIGTDVTVDKLDGVIPGCADAKTWAAIDHWVGSKQCKRAWLLVKNPVTYMRTDAALAVIAWKKLAEVFGVAYPGPVERSQLASGYSLADFYAGVDLRIAHPHKTGHAIDFSVIIDALDGAGQSYAVSDWAHPRATWPILMEGQWWRTKPIDLTSTARKDLNEAKEDQKTKEGVQRAKRKAEENTQQALDRASAAAAAAEVPSTDANGDPTNPAATKAAVAGKKRADTAQAQATAAHDKAVAARIKADSDLDKANDTVDQRQKALDEATSKEAAAKADPHHSLWQIIFRIYGHSTLDFFGDVDGSFDALYRALDGMTAALSTSLVKSLGPGAPVDAAKTFFDDRLRFLHDWEDLLKTQIGAPDARNPSGRLALRASVLRDTVSPWNYNPYSRSGGTPGAAVRAGTDTALMDYENPETAAKRNVPAGAKSFVNLTYLGWKCDMWRISNGAGRDPHAEGGKPPRQTMSPMPAVFSRLVGLIDRLRRTDSDEKSEPIVCKPLSRTLDELDVDFMLRWVRALAALRSVAPKGGKVPSLVLTNSPQVTLQLTAVADGIAQLRQVFAKLDENASNKFVLVNVGKDALLDPAILASSGKPGIVEADKGRFDTGAAWREKLENVATLFKDKVATVNLTPQDKAAKQKPLSSEKRDTRDLQITLQPVFEKATPTRLDDVAFQPSQSCELATPGKGEQLEWWHFQHKSSSDVLYPELLKQIGYWPELLWRKREAPEADATDIYNGRGMGAVIGQATAHTYFGVAHEIENGQSDTRIGL